VAEEEDEGRINKVKGGRDVRGEHRRSVPLSPTSAMTRGSLTPPRISNIAGSKPHLHLRGTCHQTKTKDTHHPAPARLHCSSFCTTYRYHVRQWPCSSPCSYACTAEGRGLPSSNANIARPCLSLLHAPHRSTCTRHVLASTKACDLRSAVHTPTTPPSTLHLHCIASEKHPTL
jgi:hypothetical protein